MDAPACLWTCLQSTPIYAWLPLAAWIASNLVTGLTQYSEAKGPLGKLRALADWLSVVSHADEPGTSFKRPFCRSKAKAKPAPAPTGTPDAG